MLTTAQIGRFSRRVEVALTNRNYDLARRVIDAAQQEAAGTFPAITLDSPLAEIGLSIRLLGFLDDAGVRTVADALNLTPDKLREIDGIGPESVREIKATLRRVLFAPSESVAP